jgi:hypothetical protein
VRATACGLPRAWYRGRATAGVVNGRVVEHRRAPPSSSAARDGYLTRPVSPTGPICVEDPASVDDPGNWVSIPEQPESAACRGPMPVLYKIAPFVPQQRPQGAHPDSGRWPIGHVRACTTAHRPGPQRPDEAANPAKPPRGTPGTGPRRATKPHHPNPDTPHAHVILECLRGCQKFPRKPNAPRQFPDGGTDD